MKKWRVTHNDTRAIWREYVQNTQPERDGSWPPEGQYTLTQSMLNASERRQWARERRQEWLENNALEILDAILLNQLGDNELLTAFALRYQTQILNRFPKDPAP